MNTAGWNRNRTVTVVVLALALVTLLVYLPVRCNDFVNYDDREYIVDNPRVNAGLTWSGILWAFQSGTASNWHPLTWISHMTDCQLFGVKPAGHHLVNVLFHAANAVLLFLLLNRLTGALWRSAFVAALFAWHPLHVESVAWASERKDVLSAFFWMLTLLAYAKHATSDQQQATRTGSFLSRVTGHRSPFYFLAVLFFACGLMSKPMVVTLPFVLLLLDFWPLQRMAGLVPLVLEKIPFFVLTIAACVVTRRAQSGAVWSTDALAFPFRLANALMSYVRYIGKIFWPADLALIYPYPHYWPIAGVIAAALFLALGAVAAVLLARRFPYLAVGWFWYLGTLVPVIGLVQVGVQSMADRYTYLPGIGLFIILAWGGNDLLNGRPRKAKIAAWLGGLALAGCLAVTSIQLNYWRNSLALFKHTVDATRDNYAALNCLGVALEELGQKDVAAGCYAKCVREEPDYPLGQLNLGMALLEQGRAGEASNHLAAAAQLDPRDPVMQFDFGLYLAQHGWPDEAAKHFKAALANRPDFPEAKTNLAKLLAEHPELK